MIHSPQSNRTSSPRLHGGRSCARLAAQLVRAAATVDAPDASALAEEALPLDNEALALADGCEPAGESTEGRGRP